MSKLENKVVIITGASEGIGRALSLKFAEQKAKIVLVARNKDRLDELKKEIESSGAEALVVPTDITDQNACEQLIKSTINHFKKIDILINNAGMTMWTPFEEINDLSIFKKIIALNYLGSVYCTHSALPYLKQ